MHVHNLLIQVTDEENLFFCGYYMSRLQQIAGDAFNESRIMMNIEKIKEKMSKEERKQFDETMDSFMAMSEDERKKMLEKLAGQ